MNRRELLGAVGLAATGITGLVGARAGDEESTGGAGRESTTATTTGEGGFTGIDSSAERPFAAVSVGAREGVRNPDNNLPHAVRVWNDSDESRTIGLRLVRGASGDDGNATRGEAVLDRQVEFPADGYLTLRLLEPASYRLDLRVGGEVAGRIEVPRARFDCNDSRTDAVVTADGRVRSVTFTTEVGCPPEVADRTFTAFGGSCGSADEASVGFDGGSVTVTGSLRTPNPCYGARLADVTVPSADAVRVTVAATEPTADVCAQCVGTVEYRADLGFRDRIPGTVEVVHRRDGESETVARVTRGGGTTTRVDGGTTTGTTPSDDGTATPSADETTTPSDDETTTPSGG